MISKVCRILITTLTFAVCAPAFGTATEADWNAGKQAYRNGDFASALVFFETARDTGLDGPAVHYNIAVSQYQLGRYGEAEATFELIARRFPKMRGLAEYNLGLTATRLGSDAEAREHFRRAYELSSHNRALRVLASRQLRVIEPEVRAASRWSGAIGVRAGNDDNVALLDETGLATGTTTDSPLAEVFAAFSGPWNGRNGLRIEGSAYLLKYVDAEDFDQSEIAGGVFYEWRPRDWRLQLGVQASTGTIGGDSYDRKVGPRLRVVRYLNHNASVDLRYRYDDVTEADSIYAGLAGTRQVIDARYRWYRAGHHIQLRYALETNDRLDAGISPDRNRFRIDYRYQPGHGLGFEAGVDLRNSDYDELATPREEDLTALHGALTYMFVSNWLLSVEYRSYSNDSTDPLYDYDRGQLTLGALKYF